MGCPMKVHAQTQASAATPQKGVTPSGDTTFEDARDATRAAAGDVVAFEALYRRHCADIHRLSRRLAGDADADDATQEVFIRLWKKVGSFRSQSTFRTWFFRLAINVLVRRARGARVSSHRIVSIADDHLAQPPVNVDARMDVVKALSLLEPDVRAVVVLHDMEGYSHDEIAQLLNIGPSASRMRLHRARATLRVHLSGDSK